MISGEEMQIIAGHLTVRALLRRGLLSVLRRIYVFIEQCYNKRVRLWNSVAKELCLFRHLMILGVNDLQAEWDTQPMVTDACLSGYAVMTSKHVVQAERFGRWGKHW